MTLETLLSNSHRITFSCRNMSQRQNRGGAGREKKQVSLKIFAINVGAGSLYIDSAGGTDRQEGSR